MFKSKIFNSVMRGIGSNACIAAKCYMGSYT